MRYFLAMLFAVLGALAATLFVSSPVATWVVAHRTFTNPDDVGDLHALVFMGINLVGLLIGWAAGWRLGQALHRPEKPI